MIKQANQGWCCTNCSAIRMNEATAKLHDCAKSKKRHSVKNLEFRTNGELTQVSKPYKTYKV